MKIEIKLEINGYALAGILALGYFVMIIALILKWKE